MYKFINFAVILIASFCNAKNLSLVYDLEQFRVCGAYCGPGWCNNKWLSENKCDTSVEPEYHVLTGYSCPDICCKNHDKCCGQSKNSKKECNREIVKCLSKCNHLSLTCTFDGIPIPAGEIEVAMYIVEDWYCGTPYPSEKIKLF